MEKKSDQVGIKRPRLAEDVGKMAGVTVRKLVNLPFNPDYVQLLVKKIRELNERKELFQGTAMLTPLGRILIDHLQHVIGIKQLDTTDLMTANKDSQVSALLDSVERFLNLIDQQ